MHPPIANLQLASDGLFFECQIELYFSCDYENPLVELDVQGFLFLFGWDATSHFLINLSGYNALLIS